MYLLETIHLSRGRCTGQGVRGTEAGIPTIFLTLPGVFRRWNSCCLQPPSLCCWLYVTLKPPFLCSQVLPKLHRKYCRNFLFLFWTMMQISTNCCPLWPCITTASICMHHRLQLPFLCSPSHSRAIHHRILALLPQYKCFHIYPRKHTRKERSPLESAANIIVSPSLYFTDALDSLSTSFQQGCPHSGIENEVCCFPDSSPSSSSLFSQACPSLFSSEFYSWCPSCLEGPPLPHSLPLLSSPLPLVPYETQAPRKPTYWRPVLLLVICVSADLPYMDWRCHEDGDHFPCLFSLRSTCHMPLHVLDAP